MVSVRHNKIEVQIFLFSGKKTGELNIDRYSVHKMLDSFFFNDLKKYDIALKIISVNDISFFSLSLSPLKNFFFLTEIMSFF